MIVSRGLIRSILFLSVLFLGLSISRNVKAFNRVLDLEFGAKDDREILALMLEERPRFDLTQAKGNRIILTIHDSRKTPELENRLAEYNRIEVGEEKGTPDLIFKITLKGPIHEIDSSWLEEKKILCIQVTPLGKRDRTQKVERNLPDLKGIRFGFKEEATRMVMNLDHEPQWEMNYSGPTTVGIRLEALSKDMKKEKYGPIKWIREVTVLKQANNGMDILLQLVSPPNRIRSFWMEVGNRLVLDFFNEPGNIPGGLLGLIQDSNTQEGNSLTSIKKSGDGAGEGGENSSATPSQEMGHFVRMKIPKREKDDSGGVMAKTPLNRTNGDNSLIVDPKLDDVFPFSSPIEASIEGLSPGEAFLFGRIQEAMEINDYEKGVLLVNQFIQEYPDSTISEIISFWRGDFYYRLWKRGDKEAGPKVIHSYEYAIDRFRNSDFKSMAYIKMAQVSSESGNHFQAVGYMGILIGQMEKDKYLPLAYLTRGKIYLSMDQPEKAIEDFKILIKEYPGTKIATEANFWIASYYHMMGLYQNAEDSLNKISDSNPDLYLSHPEYLLLRAKNSLYLNDYERAREFLFRAVNIGQQPESTDMLLSRIGDTYHHQENEKEAEKYYRMVIDYYPNSEGASIAKLRLADYFSDITILDDLSSEKNREPIGELAILEKAYQLVERKKYRAAMDTLRDLIAKPVETETRKDAKKLYYHAAEEEITRLYHAAHYDELIELYGPEKSIFESNLDPNTLILVAVAFNNIHRYEEAISTFSKLKTFDLNRKSKGIYLHGLAGSYMRIGEIEKARSLLEESKKSELDKSDRHVLTGLLADIYRENGQLKEAYRLYRSLVSGNQELPDDEIARTFLSMGKILYNQGNYKGAEALLDRSLGLAEQMKNQDELLQALQIELGKLFHAEGELAKAIKAFERGFELGYGPGKPDYWENRYRLAQSYLDSGQGSKAENVLNEITEGAGTVLQQRAQLKLGNLGLETQLQRLSLGKK